MNEKQYAEKWRGKGWTRERVEEALAVYLPGWTIRDENWAPFFFARKSVALHRASFARS